MFYKHNSTCHYIDPQININQCQHTCTRMQGMFLGSRIGSHRLLSSPPGNVDMYPYNLFAKSVTPKSYHFYFTVKVYILTQAQTGTRLFVFHNLYLYSLFVFALISHGKDCTKSHDLFSEYITQFNA